MTDPTLTEAESALREWVAHPQLFAQQVASRAVLAEYDRRGDELERLRVRVAELERMDRRGRQLLGVDRRSGHRHDAWHRGYLAGASYVLGCDSRGDES